MGRVAVVENVTLDGVMQAPGRPDEDPRRGFEHGGWAFGALQLIGTTTTSAGVMIATYRPAP